MTGRPSREDLLRLWIACCGLALVTLVFRLPLSQEIWPRAFTLAEMSSGQAAPGFVVNVTAEPTMGAVWIDGVERGPIPFFGNVRCRDGDAVTIEVRTAGHRAWSRTIACREGGSLDVRARLQRSGTPRG
ncbi:MAG: hypothetical protein AAGE94_06835 [Acidobacteriota bacterium]